MDQGRSAIRAADPVTLMMPEPKELRDRGRWRPSPQALGKDSEAVLTLRGGDIVRVAAAIANLVYHATGTRIRGLAIP
jgi:hypothetical protein